MSDPSKTPLTPATQVITDALRQHLHEHTGWPLNDEVLPPGGVDENGDEDGDESAAAA